jgi:hypothetical protein
MRRALLLARVPAVATVAAVVALIAVRGRTELVLDAYVLVLGAFFLGVLVGRIRRANPVATASPFERALAGTSSRGERLPDLEQVERELALARQTAADLHFRLRPRLRVIAARLLHIRRGIELDAEPDPARRALGDELWELVRADREPPTRRDAPGLQLSTAEHMIAALERL